MKFYHLFLGLFIISIDQSYSIDNNQHNEYYSVSTPYKEALADLDNGKCIRFYRTFIGINYGKTLFCPSYVIDNEFNRKVLLVNSSDYFYNNLDFESLGNLIYNRHDLINLIISCNLNRQEIENNVFNEFKVKIESSNCKSTTINKQQSLSYPLKSIIEKQYQAYKDQIPTSEQFKSIYLKYLNSNDTTYIDTDLFRGTIKISIGKVPDNYKKELSIIQPKNYLNCITFFSNSNVYYVDKINYDQSILYNEYIIAYFIRRYQIENKNDNIFEFNNNNKYKLLVSKLKSNESIYLIKLNTNSTSGQAAFKKSILLLLLKHDFNLDILDLEDPIPHIGQILNNDEINQCKLYQLNQLCKNSKFESYNYNQLDLLYSISYEKFFEKNLTFNINELIKYTLNQLNLNPNDLYLESLIFNREFETGKKLRYYNQIKIFNQFKDSISKEINYEQFNRFYNENKNLKDKIENIITNLSFSFDNYEFKKMYDNLYYHQLTELMTSE